MSEAITAAVAHHAGKGEAEQAALEEEMTERIRRKKRISMI